MKNLLLGSFLAALAMFVWGFIFWATPLSSGAFQSTSNYAEIGAALSELLPGDGAYHVPWYGVDEAEMMALHEQGPLATIHFRQAGAPMGSPGVMIGGFVHMLFTALMLALLLRVASPALATYGQRVAFIALAGVTATVWIDLAGPIWWYESMVFAIYTGIYDILGFVVAGLVLARFITRENMQLSAV